MFKILLSILFSIPIFLFGQSKLEILKSGFNEKKIIRKINHHKIWYSLTFRIHKDYHYSWSLKGSEILYFPEYRFSCPIDSTIYKNDLISLLVFDQKRYKNGLIYLIKNNEYNGFITMSKVQPKKRIYASCSLPNDLEIEKRVKFIKSLNVDFVFLIYGFGPELFALKENKLIVIDILKFEISDVNIYLKRKVNLDNLYKAYHPLSKKEIRKLSQTNVRY